MFVDIAKISIKAGDGGNGAISFHREKYVTSGGPDGGDGGKGGNIVFKADSNLSTLSDFRYKRKYKAQNGEDGKSGRRFGKSAEDLIIRVPNGTVIKEEETGRIIADISSDESVVIARGGKGGWGNAHFATPTRQAPRFAKPGMPGEELNIQLELKLLADVGLVGYPNVGKSTLISVVSQAKPIIANYHFTTLSPVLGVVVIKDKGSFVMADIPGLIEGAAEGAGLGHEFLRHIERCRLLVHVVDVSGSEGRDPIDDFNSINNELKEFDEDIIKRPMIVVGNKCDLATPEQIEDFKCYINEKGYDFFPIIAPINYDIDPLLNKIYELLSKLPPIKKYQIDGIKLDNTSIGVDDEIKVTNNNGVYVVESKWLLRLINSINFDDYESLQYFQKVLIKRGVMDCLRKAGAKDGDIVSIYNMEFDFID